MANFTPKGRRCLIEVFKQIPQWMESRQLIGALVLITMMKNGLHTLNATRIMGIGPCFPFPKRESLANTLDLRFALDQRCQNVLFFPILENPINTKILGIRETFPYWKFQRGIWDHFPMWNSECSKGNYQPPFRSCKPWVLGHVPPFLNLRESSPSSLCSFTAVTVESRLLTTSRGSAGSLYFWLLLVPFLLQNSSPFPYWENYVM